MAACIQLNYYNSWTLPQSTELILIWKRQAALWESCFYFYFSSAFNTQQAVLLSNELLDLQVGAPLVTSITNDVCDTIVSRTGTSLETVPAPFLFTLHDSDFRYCSQSCHLQKWSLRSWCWTHLNPVSIKGTEVDIVGEYKHLGVHIGNKLDWTKYTDALYKEGQCCLYIVREDTWHNTLTKI